MRGKVRDSFSLTEWLASLWHRRWVHRRINVKLLIALVGLLALFGTGVHFLHAYQVKRNATAIRDLAEEAEGKGELEEAEKYYSQYVGLNRDDVDALEALGRVLEKLGRRGPVPPKLWRAYEILDRVLTRDDSRAELRRHVVTLGMDLGRFPDAAQHLEVLLEASPRDGELERLAGICAAASGDYAGAIKLLEQSTRHAPDMVESYVLLAAVYRKESKPDLADSTMKRLVSSNSKRVPAYVARARYYRALGKVQEAEDDLIEAREKLIPDHPDPEVQIVSAQVALDQRSVPEARRHLERGLQAHPRNADLYRTKADLEMRTGRPREAVAALREAQGLVTRPDDLLPPLAEALLEAGEVAEAEEVIARLRKSKKAPPAWLDYLDARLLAWRGQWVEATRALERVRPLLPELAYNINLLLVRCYRQTGDVQHQLDASRRLVTADRLGETAGLEHAAAELAAGKFDRALEEYLRLESRVPLAKVRAAQLLAMRQMRLPPAQRDWTRILELLDAAALALPDALEVTLTRADMLAAQNKLPEALKVLEAVRGKHPKASGLWLALAALTARQDGAEKALAALADAGDAPEIRLARVGYLAGLRPAEARQALTDLERSLAVFPAAEQASLLNAVAAVHVQLGQRAEAIRLWQRVAELQPDDLGVRLRLFDAVRQAGEEATMERLITEVRRIEGAGGMLARQCEAAQLVNKARRGDVSAAAEARKLLREVGRTLPESSGVPLLLAELAEAEKDLDGAIERYAEAIKLGERRPDVIRRALQLMYARRRFADAGGLVKQLQESAFLTGQVGRWAAEVSLQTQDPKRALELTLQAAPRDSKDPRDHLWQGQMLAALGQKTEAEEALRRATKLGAKLPETWVTLVQFLVSTERKDAAAAVLNEAQQQLPAEELPLTLAVGYELLGEAERAAEQYRVLLAKRPDDFNLLRGLILFHLRRNDFAKAEPLLRRALDAQQRFSDRDRVWARRELACGLALAGQEKKFEEAMALLDQNEKAGEPSAEDHRVRALLLSTRAARRPEAIRLLEDLAERGALLPDDRFRLAQLHEAVNNGDQAEKHLKQLITIEDRNPRYLAHYVHSLLKHEQLAEAEKHLAVLEKLDPKGLAALSARARLLVARKQPDDAVARVRQYAETKPALLGACAALLDDLGQIAPAEEMVRKLVADSRQPETAFVLVRFLARRQRLNEALDLCEKAWEKCSPELTAGVCIAALRVGKPGAEHFRRVEPWLRKALEKNPGSIPLQIALADFHEVGQDFGKAQETYRAILQQHGRNVVALNNLAWLLSLKDRGNKEALTLIELALKETGPVPELLDTRAVILLGHQQCERAVKDLEQVVAAAPTASRYFHLAQAHQAGNNRAGMEDALRKAKKLGLTPDALHPLERDGYRQIVGQP